MSSSSRKASTVTVLVKDTSVLWFLTALSCQVSVVAGMENKVKTEGIYPTSFGHILTKAGPMECFAIPVRSRLRNISNKKLD